MEKAVGRETVRLRGEEYGKIWMLLKMFMESEDPLTVIVVIWGGPGTGKTTVARRLMDNAKHAWKNLEQIYLDPEAVGRRGLFSALQHAFGLRGYSGLEILRLLRDRLLIVIDNVETFSPVDKQVPTVLRIGEAFPGVSFFILLIFRSNSVPIDIKMVPPPAYTIYFRPYTFEEIRSMLIEFLEGFEGFSVEDKALNTISRIAGFSGDARLALAILKASLNTSKDKRVDEKHVLKVLKKLADNPLACMSVSLSDIHERVIMKILSEHSLNMRFKNLFEEYRSMAKENGVKPLSYTQLWKRVRILERKMLLDFKVSSFDGGRTGIVGRRDLDWATRL